MHGGGAADSDHRIVETICEWNLVNILTGDRVKRRKIPTNLTKDECNMFNEDVCDDLKYKESTLEGDPSEEDIDRSA